MSLGLFCSPSGRSSSLPALKAICVLMTGIYITRPDFAAESQIPILKCLSWEEGFQEGFRPHFS